MIDAVGTPTPLGVPMAIADAPSTEDQACTVAFHARRAGDVAVAGAQRRPLGVQDIVAVERLRPRPLSGSQRPRRRSRGLLLYFYICLTDTRRTRGGSSEEKISARFW